MPSDKPSLRAAVEEGCFACPVPELVPLTRRGGHRFSGRRVPVMAGILDATPVVLAWLDRMEAIGHGRVDKLSAAQAIVMCADAAGPAALVDPFFQDEHGIPLGSRVMVAAESFGPEPTEGELVAATRTRYTLRRVDEREHTIEYNRIHQNTI